MNKNQIKSAAKEIVGKLTGNTGQQPKGRAREAEGRAEKVLGNVKQLVDDVKHRA